MPETFNYTNTEETLAYDLLFNSDILDEIPVKPEWFKETKPRKVVEAILLLKEQNAIIDLSSVVAELERTGTLVALGGIKYFAQLALSSTPIGETVRLLHQLEDAYIRQQIRHIASRLAGSSMSTEHLTNDIIDTAIRDLNNVTAASVSALNTAQEGAMSVLTKAQIYENNPLAPGEVRGYDTGLIDFNAAFDGWIKGSVTYFLADEHIGKTWLMIWLLIYHHRTNPDARTILFSLEMSADTSDDPVKSTLWERIICSMSDITTKKYKSGTLTQDEWSKLNDAVAELDSWDLSIVDNVRDIGEIERICRLENRKKKLTVVCVDYLKLVIGAQGRNRNEEIGELTGRFHWLAKQIDIAMWIPQQVGGKKLQMRRNKRPNLSDGYESGHISQDAELVIGIYRDEVYNEQSEYVNLMEINFLKDRVSTGSGKRIYLFFNKSTGRIANATTSMIPLPPEPEDDYQYQPAFNN